MFYLRFKVSPSADNPRRYEIGMGFANVLVNCEDCDQAEVRARQFLRNDRWEIESLDQISVLKDPIHIPFDKELLDWYQQAQALGIFCLIAAAPPDGLPAGK